MPLEYYKTQITTDLTIKPTIIPRPDHIISRSNISDNALTVLRRLKKAGFDAHLVGGGVRDLLLGREPKDFDVVTDALPEEVRDTFRNCRLIGRRFRLAHVHFGRDIIEVATFRGDHSNQKANQKANQQANHSEGQPDHTKDENERSEISEQSAQGMLLRDNVYGTIEEDAIRRDFTVNALFYSIKDFSIIDYVNGVQDLQDGVLRLIGDPETRYREDPVRMLRAARFAAKLGFTIHEDTAEPISRLTELLAEVPAARLYEEVLKLFMGGSAVHTFEKLRQYDLFRQLFEQTDHSLEVEEEGFPNQFVLKGLVNTDTRIRNDQRVTPAFLFAVLLWEPVRQVFNQRLTDGAIAQTAMYDAADTVLAAQVRQVAIPKRFTGPMKEIWNLQLRLEKGCNVKKARKLIEHPRFRAAYDFLLLRAECGEAEQTTADWWTAYQEDKPLPDKKSAKKRSSRKRYRNRRKSKPAGQ